MRTDDGNADGDHSQASTAAPFTFEQSATVLAIIVLLGSVVLVAALGGDPDIGILCFGLSSLLLLLTPSRGKEAVTRIDWSTVLLVGGIITFVSVLQEMGAVDLLGEAAKALGSPLVAAFALCLVGGLVSAFASMTGILAALVPLALPLVADGSLPGWALIAALGVCSAVVDVSPFSTLGRDRGRHRTGGGEAAPHPGPHPIRHVDGRRRAGPAGGRPRRARDDRGLRTGRRLNQPIRLSSAA